ncbi:MAG: hemolysin family protein, partial [Actinomycetota bacterium]
VSLAVGPALRLYNIVFRPLILFLNDAANVTVRALGIEPQEELASVRSLEELQRLIYVSRREGALLEEEFSLLSRSISLTDKTATDALVPRTSMHVLDRDATLAGLSELAVETGHSRFPVIGDDMDDVVGVAHVKDSYRFEPERRASVKVVDITKPALVVPESRNLEHLLVDMRGGGKHLGVVVDEYGGTAGIITLEDILEEIVGEIEDEHDPSDSARLTRPPEGVFIVSGMLRPDEVRDATGFEMPEGEYETLAGFLLSLLQRIPDQGEHATCDGWEFKIVEIDGRRIVQVLVVAPPRDAEAAEQRE